MKVNMIRAASRVINLPPRYTNRSRLADIASFIMDLSDKGLHGHHLQRLLPPYLASSMGGIVWSWSDIVMNSASLTNSSAI
jgi:hypothetical protein